MVHISEQNRDTFTPKDSMSAISAVSTINPVEV